MVETDHRLYLLAGAALFAVGFYGLLARGRLLAKLIALNIMGSGVFLVFIAMAEAAPGAVPDPIPHAMVLTGIVVSVCATGLGLALADRVEAGGSEPGPPDGRDPPPRPGAEDGARGRTERRPEGSARAETNVVTEDVDAGGGPP